MTKEDLNQMCREYQQVLSMSEAEVFAMYEESKAECVASFEAEIDYWEKIKSMSAGIINLSTIDIGGCIFIGL